MRNLLDLMTPEDRETVKKWAEEKKNPKHKTDIPAPLFICAQLGYYYGWGAVVDFKRGYHIGYDEKGNIKRYAFGLEEAVGLIKAAEKVNYRIKLDEGKINAAANVSSHDKKYASRNKDYVNELAKTVYQ